MFKLMGKEINAILGAQTILIWTYDLPCLPSPGHEVIKLFFMLNSAEHEIYPAHKC